ncbi:undecaprenyl-phosphate galactosephosphotransferase [Azotobacter vinelandii CA]|uniref:Undecaprenyl-phosphate galactosephosphotransferase n=2 Tax=Azotobacter vinelandii TaxID=354 RepID=C1DS83_AZOVD|nr:undecaprenyl-phosphate glucose phosphotransferase [Azotobacter vinelandii]ACO77838.1 undecaprenyl-phosphate galactosephosphotransferase [Azotobacter vinelandii DJ]AGK15264.1 undecaprenyl-phosphate galactosephosphotransferase [Azotobacter vinelandii CA]AGK20011.1 undecaprenyl-phosphate galactosephosphotransferase [Azotobacter vinelandii CA6]WKN23581.1 undecaprenyl-phosphate glucose phosphotransferase [Azotobacter vinelandii]SFX86349.1 putative colanic acid biosysnthesis UDP-glucose lipid car
MIPRFQPTFAERYPVPLFVALLDLFFVIAAALLAHQFRFDNFDMSGRYNTATLLSAIVVVFCLALAGVYGSQRGRPFQRQFSVLTFAWLVAAGILLSLSFLLKVSESYSRLWFVSMLLLGWSLSLLLRLVAFLLLRHLRALGRNLKTVLLVDSGGSSAGQLSDGRALEEHGFRVVHSLPFSRDPDWLDTLVAGVRQHGVHEVWLCLPLGEGGAIRSILYALRHHTVEIRFIPEWDDIRLFNHRISHIAGLYTLDLSFSPMNGPARLIKRLEDLLIAIPVMVLILPLCLLIGLAVKLTSRGPMLFKQYRTGINGKRFKVYKFRSMVVHREKDGEVTQACRNDARVTLLGAFLRRTSLDELPQFFNVLQGRMSIVGPRPHALEHNEYYKDLVESYMQRHKVKPGITGWAQVCGYRGETDTLEKMQKRVEYDLWYIDNWSLWLDLKIIFLTVFKGFVGKNAY